MKSPTFSTQEALEYMKLILFVEEAEEFYALLIHERSRYSLNDYKLLFNVLDKTLMQYVRFAYWINPALA